MKKSCVLVVVVLLTGVTSCKDDITEVTGPWNNYTDPGPPEPKCVNGRSAWKFQCRNIDMVAHVGLEDFQGDSTLRLNDICGWTDPETGKEYALVGMSDGVSFVDISTPSEPVVVGKLEESIFANQKFVQSQANSGLLHDDNEAKSDWRDLKVYKDHVFVVSDVQPLPHGMQIFDLSRLRGVENPPVIFTEDHLYTGFGNAHNIAINEETGYAYAVGSDTHGGRLHIIDIKNPLEPVFAGFHQDTRGVLGARLRARYAMCDLQRSRQRLLG